MTDLELLRLRAEGSPGVTVGCSSEGQWALWLGTEPPDASGELQWTGGPSYLIEPSTSFASNVRIDRSDSSSGERLRAANPGNWEPIEWDELLDGRLGPWAIATEADLVASICHTPKPMTARAAECGVWTRQECRGRGYAAAVTAAWADIVRPSGRFLFYSTDAENRSSQAVARRLGLRPLGWTWRLDATRDSAVHPLSTLRRTRS